jgi:hypothetical protein
MNYRSTGKLWHQLMRGLGYVRYGAGGGDFGAGVATWMALDDPAPMIGLPELGLARLGEGSRALGIGAHIPRTTSQWARAGAGMAIHRRAANAWYRC